MRFGGYKHPKVGGSSGRVSGNRIRRAETGLGGARAASPYVRAARLTSRAKGMVNPAGSKVRGY